jgi:hypothetical protein
VANKSGTYEPAMINLPSGFYNTQASAEQDISGFDNFDLPREFDLESSTAFLIARLTIQKQAGSWAFGSVVDLRRGDLLGARGGASSPETEFPDSTFNIFDATDNTKVLAFQVDQVTTGTTRTITVPDADITLGGASEHTYVFVPDAAKGDDIAVGDQQGILHHSGDQEETVTAVYLDAETAPTGASLIIVVEFGDTDDLDTVGAWTTIDTVALTATNKSVKDSTPTQATLPANRLIRMNVTQVGSTVTGKDAAVHVKVKRKLTT